MKNINLIVFVLPMLFACNQAPDYHLASSTLHIKEIQILDPHAPETNDGIINELDGNYGESIIRNYKQSAYDAKSARNVEKME
ncbi:hypothetical protein [Moritella sp. 24]|uniref:hypothetical protein n=1 Tax=Moritella sp. 24 TaxID=2746230 RepID=UPI002104B642|nr:hypothetical protein [Moritella sp. 24]